MKMIAASIPLAFLTFGMLGCSQQASTSPAVARPAATTDSSSNTNTFGESKEEATGSAASARDAQYGAAEPAPSADSAPSAPK